MQKSGASADSQPAKTDLEPWRDDEIEFVCEHRPWAESMSRAKPGRWAEWSHALAAVEETRGALLFQEVYVGERRTSVRLTCSARRSPARVLIPSQLSRPIRWRGDMKGS